MRRDRDLRLVGPEPFVVIAFDGHSTRDLHRYLSARRKEPRRWPILPVIGSGRTQETLSTALSSLSNLRNTLARWYPSVHVGAGSKEPADVLTGQLHGAAATHVLLYDPLAANAAQRCTLTTARTGLDVQSQRRPGEFRVGSTARDQVACASGVREQRLLRSSQSS